jgi:hypothetical protein
VVEILPRERKLILLLLEEAIEAYRLLRNHQSPLATAGLKKEFLFDKLLNCTVDRNAILFHRLRDLLDGRRTRAKTLKVDLRLALIASKESELLNDSAIEGANWHNM